MADLDKFAAEQQLQVDDRAFAEHLDAQDPLKHLRTEFAIPSLGSILRDAAPRTWGRPYAKGQAGCRDGPDGPCGFFGSGPALQRNARMTRAFT